MPMTSEEYNHYTEMQQVVVYRIRQVTSTICPRIIKLIYVKSNGTILFDFFFFFFFYDQVHNKFTKVVTPFNEWN